MNRNATMNGAILTARRSDARLHFYRYCTQVQRFLILLELGAFPRNLEEYPNMTKVRDALDKILSAQALSDENLKKLEAAIDRERLLNDSIA